MRDRPSAEELVSLGERIAEQAVHLDAAMHRLLADLRRFDEAGGWYAQGFASCAHWLSHRVGWDLGTARERVRVARALAGLPRVDAALAAGQLSYSKARAVTRVATPVTEPTLLQYAEVCTASQLETLCRKFHAAERIEADPKAALPREEDRYVVVSETASGMVCVKAFLRPDEAALLMQAIQHAAGDCVADAGKEDAEDAAGSAGTDAVKDDADGCAGSHPPADVSAGGPSLAADDGAPAARPPRSRNRADGLMALAQAYARGHSAQRSPIELIVTTSAEMLRPQNHKTLDLSLAPSPASDASGIHVGSPSQDAPCACPTDRGASVPATAVAETDLYLSPETTRRLACDCGLVEATVDAQGEPLSIGRKTRTIPAAIKRALLLRDRTCRFPGCDHRLYLDGHHLQHWADGGETSLLNTCLLCSTHHARVHEDGYRISRDDQGALTFFDPRGKVVVAVPPRPSPPQLGWPAIRAANAALDLSAESLAPKGRWGRLDAGEAVGRLFRVKQSAAGAPAAGTPSSRTMPAAGPLPSAGPRAARHRAPASMPPAAEDAERWEDDAAEIAHAFWAGGQRGDELLEWALAELEATGIDPMAQVPAPYCAPAGWRASRSHPPAAPPAGLAGD